MIKYEYGYKAYVAGDGNYGVDTVITFDFDELLAEYPKVWELLDHFGDYYRLDFIQAFLDQDEEELARMAEEHDFLLADVLD